VDDLTLNETLTGIFDALLQHESTDGDAIIASLGPTLLTCVHDGPEAFHDRLQYPWQNALNAAVRAAYPTVRESNLSALQFCYSHGDFLTTHLEHLFEQFEGHFACADKANWVLQEYHYSLTTSTKSALLPVPDSRKNIGIPTTPRWPGGLTYVVMLSVYTMAILKRICAT